MIDYIDQRLTEWGEWSRARMDGYFGLGGGGFAYIEPMPGQPPGWFRAPTNLRCLETESGVALLRVENWKIGEAVILRYRSWPHASGDLQAQMLGISRMTLWRYLDTAHALLWAYFVDRAFGLVPQTEALRLARKIAA